jgi:indolepyruvate ferredoxin oxidoreductase alpha subunit
MVPSILERPEGQRAVEQLLFGPGQTILGDGALILTKALLENGVGYLGGYPGSPVAHIVDLFSAAYKSVLEPMGVYFEASNNEASAASLLMASVNHPVRGAVCWKVVGTNVASDALAHLAASGVRGGVIVLVGEDYSCTGTTVAERTLPVGVKSSIPVVEPLASPADMARLVGEAFELSEASRMPVLYVLPTRVANLKGSIPAGQNRPPGLSALKPLEQSFRDPASVTLPPWSRLHERKKAGERLPQARRFIYQRRLNKLIGGCPDRFGIVAHGALANLVVRCLSHIGLSGRDGALDVDLLALRALFPLVPEEIEEFAWGKRALLVLEEGRPSLLEDQIRGLLQRSGSKVAILGKDDLGLEGEMEPGTLKEALSRVLEPRGSTCERDSLGEAPRPSSSQLPSRTPIFCTGCPERPIFSALKILQAQGHRFRFANDIGCYSLAALAPFGFADSLTAMGTGLATTGALSRLTRETVVAFMGDGTFWHSGLTTSVINALQNNTDVILVIFENFHVAMTGGQPIPGGGLNARGEPAPAMEIDKTLRACGVRWIRVVNPYDLEDSLSAFRQALGRKGLRVLLSRAECELIAGRRRERQKRLDEEGRRRWVKTQFGVDPELCTGDQSCIALSGCPSLSLTPGPNPLRHHLIVDVDSSCTGCGLCGELAEAAKLCPAFFELIVVSNPTRWERIRHRLWRRLVGMKDGAEGSV